MLRQIPPAREATTWAADSAAIKQNKTTVDQVKWSRFESGERSICWSLPMGPGSNRPGTCRWDDLIKFQYNQYQYRSGPSRLFSINAFVIVSPVSLSRLFQKIVNTMPLSVHFHPESKGMERKWVLSDVPGSQARGHSQSVSAIRHLVSTESACWLQEPPSCGGQITSIWLRPSLFLGGRHGVRKRDGERRPLFEVRGQTYTQSDLKETPHREITPYACFSNFQIISIWLFLIRFLIFWGFLIRCF